MTYLGSLEPQAQNRFLGIHRPPLYVVMPNRPLVQHILGTILKEG